MPPLEMAPGCYIAAKGTAENDELSLRAHDGEFEIWDVNELGEKESIYQVFSPDNESMQTAGPAVAFEYSITAVFRRVYPGPENIKTTAELEAVPEDTPKLIKFIGNAVRNIRRGK